ncbi:hypothetical protein EST38_g368 [Candolleomyces aberdarensis]|uniref:Uncharacterized protein n=1 Tax=Candolleomyces aberdarensis TaxID=2316362 RepID=A0A4Q2DYN1_9AGAR|nr:hypothetical protein EST38_g368 [Candolleomyces aberdarensis]
MLPPSSPKPRSIKSVKKGKRVTPADISLPIFLDPPPRTSTSSSGSIYTNSSESNFSFVSKHESTPASSMFEESFIDLDDDDAPSFPVSSPPSRTPSFKNRLWPRSVGRKGDTPESPSKSDHLVRQEAKPQPRVLKKPQPLMSGSDLKKKKDVKEPKNERPPELSLSDLGKVNAYFAEIPPEYVIRHDQLQSAKAAMFKSDKDPRAEPKLTPPTLGDESKVDPGGFFFTPDSAGWDEDDVSLPVALREGLQGSPSAPATGGLYSVDDPGSVGSLASLSAYWENRDRAKKRTRGYDELDIVIPRRPF